jgi:hypothetical protein
MRTGSAEVEMLSPLGARDSVASALAPRPSTLAGARVALIDNRKPGAHRLLEGVQARLLEAGVSDTFFSYKLASRPHPDLRALARDADVVVGALGD